MKNQETEQERKDRELFMELFMANKRLVSVLKNQKRLLQEEVELTTLIRELNDKVLQ